MFTTSETTATVLIVLLALGILSWGFYRAKPYGKVGILTWLQSVVLMLPWLVLFGSFAAGIYLNLIVVLFFLVASAGFYIFLGNQLRAASQDVATREKLSQMVNGESGQDATGTEQTAVQNTTAVNTSSTETAAPLKLEVLPIPEADLTAIQGIFGIDTFFATETIPYQEGAIFKGNMRGEAEAVHSRLSASLQERLGDRYRLFLLENPEGKPTIVVLPSSNDPQPATIPQKILAVILIGVTIATTLETAGFLLNFDFFASPSRIQEVLPLSLGFWIVLAAHEFGHWFIARRHQVRLSFPFFLPALQIGAYGAITRFESLLPNRTVLFDISLAGPALGGIVSLTMLIVGLLLSHQGSLFQLPSQFFQASILVGTLARVVLGSAVQNPLVDVHPLVIVGWLGLVITALNLMPAGQLDGGRIVQAIYGRKTAQRTTVATLIVLGIVAFTNPANPIPLYWAFLILFLQRSLERPSLNEITEPDDARAAFALLALFLMIATLIPLSPGLAGSLGIGR